MRFEVVLTYSYEVPDNREFDGYGTTDPDEMAAIDAANDPMDLWLATQPSQYVQKVTPIRGDVEKLNRFHELLDQGTPAHEAIAELADYHEIQIHAPTGTSEAMAAHITTLAESAMEIYRHAEPGYE